MKITLTYTIAFSQKLEKSCCPIERWMAAFGINKSKSLILKLYLHTMKWKPCIINSSTMNEWMIAFISSNARQGAIMLL